MLRSKNSLPPQVDGAPRGTLMLALGNLAWAAASKNPPPSTHLAARITWWGSPEGSPSDDIPLPRDGNTSAVAFTLCSGPQHVDSYLSDVGTLELLILDVSTPAPKAIGKLFINATTVGPQSVDLVCVKTGNTLGTMEAALATTFVEAAAEPPKEAGAVQPLTTPGNPAYLTAAPVTKESAASLAAATTPREEDEQQALSGGESSPNGAEKEEERAAPVHAVLVRIDSAFQLPEPTINSTDAASRSFMYASAMWQRDRSRCTNTHLAAVHAVPAVGPSAVWQTEVGVAVDAAAFDEIAQSLLPGSEEASRGGMDRPLLLINIWKATAPAAAGLNNPTEAAAHLADQAQQRRPATATPFDRLVGCAAVDLSALLLGQESAIQDRFPIVNAQHQVQGIVKARVTPNAHLAAVLERLRADVASVTTASHADAANEPRSDDDELNLPLPAERRPIGGGRKQEVRYAWSGSDSDEDEGFAMVGVSYEGAVSCEEDEEEEAVATVGGGRNDGPQPRPALMMTQDWMFDISKGVGSMGLAGLSEIAAQREAAASAENSRRKAVVFKNKLPPGAVVEERSGLGRNSFFAPTTGTDPFEQVAPLQNAAAVNSRGAGPATGVGVASPSVVHQPFQHHSSLDGDWLFGIGRPRQFGVPLPTPAGSTQTGGGAAAACSSQFEPMNDSK